VSSSSLQYYIHLPYEKSGIKRKTIHQYVKDRTESFDDHFPCKKGKKEENVNYNIS
jgi:hypothetical protein